LLGLGILLVAAGCATVPFDGASEQDRPVELVLNNSATAPQTFEVWVVDADATVTVSLNDSRTANTTIGEGLATSSAGDYYYTAVELPESARLHGRFAIDPGKEERSSIDEFPRDYAVVVVLHQDDKIGWWASAHCSDGALVGLEVTTRPSRFGDAGARYGCQ
jgi:hypothetical protein